MAEVIVRVEQPARAKPAVVYDVLMNVERWSAWMPTVSAASWERPGSPGTGTGGIRRVRAGILVTRDRIVDGARPHHHAYTASLPRFWPVRDFRGDVLIEERPKGCIITWTIACSTFVQLAPASRAAA